MNKNMHIVDGGFLQSNYWKNFQESLGRKTQVIEEEGFSALMIFHELPVVGGYYFVPRGPSLVKVSENKSSKGLEEMIDIVKENNLGWVRVEPQTQGDLNWIENELGGKYNIVKSKKNHEPAETLMIDLIKDEDEILANMKSKIRYNIRLATKKGVEVFDARDGRHIEKFVELTKETAKRDGIVSHPNQYYEKMVESIPNNVLRLYFAKFDEKIISAVMVSYYGKVATYLHGASSNEHRNMMAPFALQWRAMKDAKKEGCTKYDLGGTKILKTGDGSWGGITRFKRGFCPKNKPVEFPGSWDVIVDTKKYKLYLFLQGVSDLKRKIVK
ncbi:MAG: peptidoglycan bridge formation glycyltransferase FemA/FemB family protein [Patescibacteria group bacterium]|nr:peptidoglycan bridge formation glycyltransferase FemA/FemB family protein [Patescibacteria group bacterium]